MTPEGYEKEKVKKFLTRAAAYQFWPVQIGYGAATVDCLACIAGHFVGIEVKRADYKNKSYTNRQLVTLQRINQSGGVTFCGNSEEITKELAQWMLKEKMLDQETALKFVLVASK